MKIFIVGDGKVGFTIAKQLDKEGHDLTIIDNNPNVIENTMNLMDVDAIVGNGASYDTLKEAGIDEADLLIAATSADEVNIISCLMAKKMGVTNTIARIRTPEYVQSASVLKDELGLSLQVNPEKEAAREIMRAIRYSKYIHVSSFAKGRVEIATIKIREANPLIDMPIAKISRKYKANILFCMIKRGKETIIPNGDTIIKAGDKVSLTGTTRELETFLAKLVITRRHTVNEVMIVGGSRTSYYLTKRLLNLNIDVKIIEQKPERCQFLAEKFPEATIICGDGTDHELLRSENLEQMDAFIALTGNDEENVIVSLYAASKGVQRVLPKVNHISVNFLLDNLNLENIVEPKQITANQITQYVRAMQNVVGSNVESLISLDDEVEALEFRVRENCKFIKKPLKDIKFRKDIIVAYVSHHSVPKIPTGETYVSLGDTMVIITKKKGLRDINDILA